MDNTEKYLLEYHKINAYKMIMIEGIFGLLITSVYSIHENPFKELKEFNNKKNNYILLSIFLFLYFLLSGGRNIYRILTNKIYSPMTKIITDCFLDPILIIYYFLFKNDLNNIFFFIINLILLINMDFFGLVYNDFLILYCCNLEYDTYYEITKRAKVLENKKTIRDSEMRETIDDYFISFQKNKTIVFEQIN